MLVADLWWSLPRQDAEKHGNRCYVEMILTHVSPDACVSVPWRSLRLVVFNDVFQSWSWRSIVASARICEWCSDADFIGTFDGQNIRVLEMYGFFFFNNSPTVIALGVFQPYVVPSGSIPGSALDGNRCCCTFPKLRIWGEVSGRYVYL